MLTPPSTRFIFIIGRNVFLFSGYASILCLLTTPLFSLSLQELALVKTLPMTFYAAYSIVRFVYLIS